MSENPVAIVGGGLSGCLMALMLAKRGLHVILIEKRKDPSCAQEAEEESVMGRLGDASKRSINLALSYRGICALEKADLMKEIECNLIPMKGRVIHHQHSSELEFQSYGRDHQAIHSISRDSLNALLVQKLKSHPNVSFRFESKCSRISKSGDITITGKETLKLKPLFIIGADGAFSSVRSSLMKISRINYEQFYIESGYKELTIPALGNDFALEQPEGLHIWPRHNFMLIALPNPDKSFTCTLFAPFEGNEGLDVLSASSDKVIQAYFDTHFPDVTDKIPHLVQQFRESPNSPLITVKCKPWNFEDKAVLIGDAAHAVVPFYGQGMNAGFEDCLLFDEIWEEFHGDVGKVLKMFSDRRQPSADGLAYLSLQNYKEMSSLTVSNVFLLKSRVDKFLHYLFPKYWLPLYSMVAFSRIPYHKAIERAKHQEFILFCAFAAVTAFSAFKLASLFKR